jgi:hypothetical protein
MSTVHSIARLGGGAVRKSTGRERPSGRGGLVPAFDSLETPLFAPEPEGAGTPSLDLMSGELDDATTAYVLATRAPFDLLRAATSQLAGLMVLAVSGARNDAAPAVLDRVREEHAEAGEAIRSRSGSVPARAAHHHRHLSRACDALGAALAACADGIHGRDEASADAIMTPLNAAYRQLQWATGALPGFEVVALSQGCCAAHAGLVRR